MNAEGPVVIIGASGIDTKGRPQKTLQMGVSNLGMVRSSVGGVARNIAENLARLEVPTILLSAVGQDAAGDFVLAHTSNAGVDTRYILRLPDVPTGNYVAILDHKGQLAVSVSEYDIVRAISPSYLQEHRTLLAEAAMIVIDTSLSTKTLASVFRWAKRFKVPVCADPTSQLLAKKLLPYLADLYLVTPDIMESTILCQTPSSPPRTRDQAIEAAQCLVSLGAGTALITMAERGVAFADGTSTGHVAALLTQIVDATGAGDALTAAVIFGLLNDIPLDEAVRLGVTAASLTLRTRHTVAPDLSLDKLYDELVV